MQPCSGEPEVVRGESHIKMKYMYVNNQPVKRYDVDLDVAVENPESRCRGEEKSNQSSILKSSLKMRSQFYQGVIPLEGVIRPEVLPLGSTTTITKGKRHQV